MSPVHWTTSIRLVFPQGAHVSLLWTWCFCVQFTLKSVAISPNVGPETPRGSQATILPSTSASSPRDVKSQHLQKSLQENVGRLCRFLHTCVTPAIWHKSSQFCSGGEEPAAQWQTLSDLMRNLTTSFSAKICYVLTLLCFEMRKDRPFCHHGTKRKQQKKPIFFPWPMGDPRPQRPVSKRQIPKKTSLGSCRLGHTLVWLSCHKGCKQRYVLH